jgi:hypothetical protein
MLTAGSTRSNPRRSLPTRDSATIRRLLRRRCRQIQVRRCGLRSHASVIGGEEAKRGSVWNGAEPEAARGRRKGEEAYIEEGL